MSGDGIAKRAWKRRQGISTLPPITGINCPKCSENKWWDNIGMKSLFPKERWRYDYRCVKCGYGFNKEKT